MIFVLLLYLQRVKIEAQMDPRETKGAIIETLELYESSGYDKKKRREARKQYDSIMTHQLSSFALEVRLQACIIIYCF